MRLTLSQLRNIMYYSTPRSASIKSIRIGIIYRIAQLIILFYIIGYDIILNRGYQKLDRVSSTVTTKVKGQGFVPINQVLRSYSDMEFESQSMFSVGKDINFKMLDTSDYVVPPNEYNSIFIMTNFIETFQTQGTCPEESSKYKSKCKSDQDCQNLGTITNSWNGFPTGKCVNSTFPKEPKLCEIRAWCPTENEDNRINDTLIRNVLNYTILIKNDIEYKKFNLKHSFLRRNILPNATNKYISQCNFHTIYDSYCPVFRLDYILDKVEPDPKEKYNLLIKGGLIVIEITWNCDLDFGRICLPKYTFKRFDTKETNTATGFNFRYAHKFRSDGMEYRVLIKAYGLRFIINVSGTAGKFNIIPLLMTIGAGIGIMSVSAMVTDCILLHFSKDKHIYKYMVQLDEDAVKLKLRNQSIYDLDDLEEIVLSTRVNKLKSIGKLNNHKIVKVRV